MMLFLHPSRIIFVLLVSVSSLKADKYLQRNHNRLSNKPCQHQGPFPTQILREETRSISELYRSALSSGGKLLVYAGGDTPDQQNSIKSAFESQFPGIDLQIVVDFSKNHNARIDNQISRGKLLPDIAQLQTLHDFDRWKSAGLLHPYKPLGWREVYPEFKDPTGHYMALFVDAFSTSVNKDVMGHNPKNWPREAKDYLNPELRGKIVSTYPNDDDAVLYWYWGVVAKYGWSWLEKFVENQPLFVRGTQSPFDMIWNSSTQMAATFSTDGNLKQDDSVVVQFLLPKNDSFVSWGQRAAIFKGAQNLASAKLYLSWWLSLETQRDIWTMWSVRRDVPPPTGYKSIFDYQRQTDPHGFETWMKNREEVERFKAQVELYVGEVVGPSPTRTEELGLDPVKMLV